MGNTALSRRVNYSLSGSLAGLCNFIHRDPHLPAQISEEWPEIALVFRFIDSNGAIDHTLPLELRRRLIRPFPFHKPVSAASSFTLVFPHPSAALWANQVNDR
jgi:hypothetical protein